MYKAQLFGSFLGLTCRVALISVAPSVVVQRRSFENGVYLDQMYMLQK